MSSTSNATALDMFKEVYGDGRDIVPQDQMLSRDIPFSQRQKVGEKFVQAVVLTRESGITLSSSTDAFTINAPRAGVIREAEVTPYISILPSIVPWGVMSRSAGAGKQAFYDATKFIVKNNIRSHEQILEILRFYGQSSGLLGYTSYYTGTYRGAAFTAGTGTLNGVTFTNGINAASKIILFQSGSFAAGHWVAMEGIKVNQVDSTGAIVASGSLVSVNADYGYITVDFTPIAASSATSHRMCYDGMQSGNDLVGIQKVLSTTTGNLFGIPVANFSLWRGVNYDVNSQALTLGIIETAVAQAVNRGGLVGDLKCYVNPRTWATITTTEAGLRVYDSSYNGGKKAENGFKSITFYTQAGEVEVVPHRCVKEGDAFALYLPAWSRSGSSEVSFSIPGMARDIIFSLENQAGDCFRSFSDQYIFCDIPANNIYFSGIAAN